MLLSQNEIISNPLKYYTKLQLFVHFCGIQWPKSFWKLQNKHVTLRTNTVMGSNQDTDEFVYPSNSDDLDFEESFRTIRDDTSEIFDPPPSPSSSLGSEMESVEENQTNLNSDEPNPYGLQETPIYNYSGDAEIEQDFHDGWSGWPHSSQDKIPCVFPEFSLC